MLKKISIVVENFQKKLVSGFINAPVFLYWVTCPPIKSHKWNQLFYELYDFQLSDYQI